MRLLIALLLAPLAFAQYTPPGGGGGGGSAASPTNSIQKNGGSGAFAASSITDDGSTVTTTEPISALAAKVTSLGGLGTKCLQVDNSGNLGTALVGCNPGGSNYSQTFSTLTSVPLTHGLGTTAIVVQCFNAATPPVNIEWNTLTLTDSNTATVTFTNAQSGTCIVSGAGGGGGGGGGAVASVTGTAPIASTGGSNPVISLANFTGDSGSGGTAGAVPAPSAGDAAAGKFLGAGGAFINTFKALVIPSIATKTTNYTVTGTDFTIVCDATLGAVTLTLPASPATGQVVNAKKTDATANACTISGNGKSIDGTGSISTVVQFQGYTLQYDGSQWWLL